MTTIRKRTIYMAELALLTAIILVMAFTPLGYLKTAGLEITFLTVPVVIGAILTGPAGGAFLGGVFGLTSFFQAASGLSAFGATLFNLSPISTFLLCLVPRILVGLIAGWVFKGLQRVQKSGVLGSIVASLAGPISNTVMFMTLLVLLFRGFILELQQGTPLFPFLVAFVGLNGLVEAIACTVLGAAISIPLRTIISRRLG